jgi:tRNA1Val (adenine37-N6)-methyltransferase
MTQPLFAPNALSHDAFLCGKLHLWQPIQGYRAATDPVLLAAACPATPGQRVLDLGCGVGAAALCLGARVPGLVLAGLEVQPAYAALARRNAEENGLTMQIEEGDLADMPSPLRVGFDHVIANPPYYPAGGTPSPIAARARALQVDTPLGDWVQAAARRLNPGGWMTLICGADGLPAVLGAMGSKLGSASVLPLQPRNGKPALRVIVRARKGGRGAFRLLAPFVLHQGATHDGDRESYTDRANAVLRQAASLSAEFL